MPKYYFYWEQYKKIKLWFDEKMTQLFNGLITQYSSQIKHTARNCVLLGLSVSKITYIL